MCGIAGYAGTEPLPQERIDRALELMRHRGPDDASWRSFTTPQGRTVTLLHRRLSIIDLDPRSNQPFQAGPLWLATNGELYNYLEVREGLERDGIAFHTSSDTEVLAAALAHGGWDALEGCEGMWAFATYDERTGALGLCRDRFGEKPLFVHRDGDALYYALRAEVPLRAPRPHARAQPPAGPALPRQRLQEPLQDR